MALYYTLTFAIAVTTFSIIILGLQLAPRFYEWAHKNKYTTKTWDEWS